MSLLKITTTPIEYEIKIERAKLRAKEQDFQDVKQEQAAQARRQRMAERKVNLEAAKEAEQASKNTDNYLNVARSRSAAVKSTTASELSLNSSQNSVDALTAAVSQDITTAVGAINFDTDFGFDTSAFVSYSSDNEFSDANDMEWTISKNEMEFVPGRFQMDIIQYPRVDIEYLGNAEKGKLSSEI